MTTREPGAREVFTHGLLLRPRSTAFFASRPAPSITDGFEVFVQDVMAAMTTCPWSIRVSLPASLTVTGLLGHCSGSSSTGSVRGGSFPAIRRLIAIGSLAGNDSADASSSPPSTASSTDAPVNSARNVCWATRNGIRSWGRFGPAIEDSTVARSSSTTCEKAGSWAGSCQSPCSFA